MYKNDWRLFQHIRQSAGSKKDMQISPQEGQIISLLLQLKGAKLVIEIGALVGYSTVWIGSALPRDGRVISFEKDITCFKQARHNISKMTFSSKIKLVYGLAEEQLSGMLAEAKADAFFIDAKKSDYPMYLALAHKYLKKGGLLMADNTLLSGKRSNFNDFLKKMPCGVKKFNNDMASGETFSSTILTTKSGLTVGIKK